MDYSIFLYGGRSAWKIGVERVGGRSASARVGVGVGIHDTVGTRNQCHIDLSETATVIPSQWILVSNPASPRFQWSTIVNH